MNNIYRKIRDSDTDIICYYAVRLDNKTLWMKFKFVMKTGIFDRYKIDAYKCTFS